MIEVEAIPIMGQEIIEMISVPVTSIVFYPEWYFHAYVFTLSMIVFVFGVIIGSIGNKKMMERR